MKNKEEKMDYEKLTKAELIEKLKKTKHLAETVRVKDSTVAELRRELADLKAKQVEIENKDLQKALEVNKELVAENKEVFSDLRYVLTVFSTFLGNFQNNSQLIQLLLKQYLNGGK